jgi:hypothetical protein
VFLANGSIGMMWRPRTRVEALVTSVTDREHLEENVRATTGSFTGAGREWKARRTQELLA